jgi:exonuclease III
MASSILPSTAPLLTFSSINCNSLNVSKISSFHQQLKLYGIVKLKSDIIFLSDTRLNSSSNAGHLDTITNQLIFNPYCSYSMFHNSLFSSRSTAILIKKSLNISVSRQFVDPDCNILGLSICFEGTPLNIICIYGPNNFAPTFFDNLSRCIKDLGPHPLIVSGDWNCTFSTNNVGSNIDVLNMVKLPNLRHSLLLQELCVNHSLTDPFRLFNPNRREYSYSSKVENKLNKSRLDFFLCSMSLIDSVSSCGINECLQSRLFDHKAIFLSFVPVKSINALPTISSDIHLDPVTDLIVRISVLESYVTHSCITNNFSLDESTSILQQLGEIRFRIREIMPLDLADHSSTNDDYFTALGWCDRRLSSLELLNLCDNELQCDYDQFLEILIMNIRNNVINYQAFKSKVVNSRSLFIKKQLVELKLDYLKNAEVIVELEKTLLNFEDKKLQAQVLKYKSFESLNKEKITPFTLKLLRETNKEFSVREIKDDNGNPFSSSAEQSTYIRNFFAKIYEPDFDESNVFRGCIEKFLGPEIINHPVVKNSKLSSTVCT